MLRAGDVRAVAPTGFAASNGNEQVTLTWDAPAEDADIARHEYRFKTTGDYPAAWTGIEESAPGGLHEDWVVVTGLTNDVAYTFELRTVNAGGDASTAVEAGPATPKDGVCGRTEQVRGAIVGAIASVSDCADVTTTQLAGVTALDLSHAGIKSLQPGDFSGLTALTDLDLNTNELSLLPAGVFSSLTALTDLDLNTNELSLLPAGVFSSLTALTDLDLNTNELSLLPAGVFSSLTALTDLDLNTNELSLLPAGVFSGLTALTGLDLKTNELSLLPAGVFSSLTALTGLDLKTNELSLLPAGVFSSLTALTDLDLNTNELSSLPAGVFSGLTALTNLRLNGNQLSSLPVSAFSGLTALTDLRLRDNQLRSLPVSAFFGVTTLDYLYLDRNPVDPLPLPVTLERNPDAVEIRAVVPAAAPFAVPLSVSVANGSLAGGATTITVPSGARESAWVGVTRTDGTTGAVTADVDLTTQPTLPGNHQGYAFVKSASDLPLTVLRGTPGAPGAPSVSAASSSSLTVMWSAPDDGGSAVTDYDVQYRAGASGDWTDGNHDGTATTATLTGLASETTYEVQVRATNEEGTGSWSDAGTGATDGNVAPAFSSPATFSAAENQTTAGTVLARDSDAEDDVTGYAITGGADKAFFSIGATSGALEFQSAPNYEDPKDSDNDNNYVVEVKATSGMDTREKTATQTITVRVTDIGTEAPGQPAAPMVTAASASSLTVNWLAPPNAGPAIMDYDVQYRAGTSGSWTDGGHNGTATTATLTGLSENTSYQVQVRAKSDEGTGAWSDAGTGTAVDPNSGICGRTPRVRDRILVLLKFRHSYKGNCSGVTGAHLAKLKSLDLGRNPSIDSPFAMSLQGGDFEGLVNLERLYMRETGLQSLPAGVFDGLAKLEELELNKNKLQSLPPGVFSDLRSLESLKLQNNPSLASLPFDEFEALPQLTKLMVDREGRRKLQVAGGEGDASLEVAAGRSATYRVRLMATTNARAADPVKVTVSSDVSAVTASPVTVSFTRENWFRRQTVTVSAVASASGTTAKLTHGADGAYYAYDRWPLPGVTVTVVQSGQSGDAAGLTAEFEGLPPEGHGGETAFSFRIAFSEDVATSADDMCDHAFQASGGAVRGARRLQKGSNRMWEMTVKPNSNGPVTITLPATTDCGAGGAICTGDGRPLSHALSATLRGPAGTMEQDRAARLCSALAGGDDITPATVAAALWEDGDMSDDRLAALDSLGNGNGSYDLGDRLAWMARCRRGEGPGSASGTDPPAAGANGPADHLVSGISVHSPGDDLRDGLPAAFALRGNYPNPFQRATQIVFDLPWRADVTVDVLDVLGRRMLSIPSQPISRGWERRIYLSGVSLPSGPYLYRVQASAQEGEGVSVLVGRFMHIK